MAEVMITSTILILALILFRRICRGKISRRLQYGLWLLVVIRLLVPAQFFTSSLSVMQLIDYAGEAVYEQWQTVNIGGQGDAAGKGQSADLQADGATAGKAADGKAAAGKAAAGKTEAAGKAETDGWAGDADKAGETGRTGQWDMQAERNLPDSSLQLWNGAQAGADGAEGKGNFAWGIGESRLGVFPKVLPGIYIVGVFLIAGCLIVCNLRFRRKLAAGRQRIGQEGRLKVYLAEQLESPCLCGFFAPAIYINEPGLASEERTRHILVHEMTHYRHLDHIWAVIRSICITLYWFHPLVWVAAVLSIEDSELACDEGTLVRLGEENRQAYGRTLIEMMTARRRSDQLLYCATGMINGKKEIRERITAIADYKKHMIWTGVLVVAFALLLSACTAGAASIEEDESGQSDVSVQNDKEGQSDASVQNGEDGQPDISGENDAAEQVTDSDQDGEVKLGEGVILNDDGSFRLSEYEVDLTGDKVKERIVFDVQYWTDLTSDTGMITEELLWEKLWSGSEIMVKILDGEGNEVLQEYSFSSAHAGNGNLAVIRYEKQMCILRYGNTVYQGYGQFWYQVWQILPSGNEPILLTEKEAPYVAEVVTHEEEEIAAVLEVGEELDEFLSGSYTDILVNATIAGQEYCYLYGGEEGLLNGVRRQNAFDVFMAEVGGTGLELKLEDYFYPEGKESLTQLPEDAEKRILAGEILCMEVSQENNTAGRLDVDGDGEKEVLYLDAVGNAFNHDGWRDGIIDTSFRLRVDDQYYEAYCDMMDPVLMAYSPDGKQILLAVYDDGPSGDPLTSFFRYDESGVHPAGSITDDLRSVTINEEGIIRGSYRVDMIQTEWVDAYYYWNGSEIVMREDEVYYYVDDSAWREQAEWPLVLLAEVTVYEERSESSRSVIMKPQEVKNVATDMKEWIFLEAEDGTKGWLRVVQLKIPSLGNKSTSAVFDGLNMAD